jgi:hypothetical protein
MVLSANQTCALDGDCPDGQICSMGECRGTRAGADAAPTATSLGAGLAGKPCPAAMTAGAGTTAMFLPPTAISGMLSFETGPVERPFVATVSAGYSSATSQGIIEDNGFQALSTINSGCVDLDVTLGARFLLTPKSSSIRLSLNAAVVLDGSKSNNVRVVHQADGSALKSDSGHSMSGFLGVEVGLMLDIGINDRLGVRVALVPIRLGAWFVNDSGYAEMPGQLPVGDKAGTFFALWAMASPGLELRFTF